MYTAAEGSKKGRRKQVFRVKTHPDSNYLLPSVESQDMTTSQSNATKCAHMESIRTHVSQRHWHIDTDNLARYAHVYCLATVYFCVSRHYWPESLLALRQHFTRQNNALTTFCHEVADYFIFTELLFIVGTARRQKANGVGNAELLQSYSRLFRYTRPGKSYIIETPALCSFLWCMVRWISCPVDRDTRRRTRGLNYVPYGPDSAATETSWVKNAGT